jgi:SAM-dependent methyltransferase
VLDVGCGSGLDTSSIQLQVEPDGLVAGLDYDLSLIREARDLLQRNRQSCRATHLVANAAFIPYRDASFDRCFSERMLQHTTDAAVVIREILRVTKPGGAIVVADTDWATLSIDTPAIVTERALVRFVGDTLCNGYAGRQLRRLLADHGLTDIHVEVWPIVWTDYTAFRATSLSLLDIDQQAVRAGALSASDLAAFYRTLAAADRRGAFFASGTVVIARGRKLVER